MKLLALVTVAVAITAQEVPFRSESRVVQVPVTVSNEKGTHVDGLKLRDFTVLDDGQERAISLDTFGTGMAPISLAIAIETSAISKPALARIHRIGSMIQPLVIGRRGEAAVLTFDDRLSWRLNFTSDSDAIRKTIASLAPGDSLQSHMLDAVVDVADAMKERKGRRILLLICEARDRGSRAKLEEAIEAVEREGVEVFAATYSAQAQAQTANPDDLPAPIGPNYFNVFSELSRAGKTSHAIALTQATGGAHYMFLREHGVEKAIENLGVDVHAQYILSFPQPSDARGMRRIDVSMSGDPAPNRADLRIRFRRAYWADAASPPQ
ncbi:MAG TPA: VWA domain-containing protein [Bryobacteraceae bacterium]|nr:VWA domain-containing protein [Bryobacteraceae bacterium]